MKQLMEELTPEDVNIRILPFASAEELADRLNAADIHLISLRENWAGIVVPSKFFGSLAAGKPVIYSGSEESCIGQWIRENDVGLLLDRDNTEAIAADLKRYADNPRDLTTWKRNAYQTYHDRFSKDKTVRRWYELLESEIGAPEHA
jgi:glycosyltransferase involved in cell wall biosynthesis